MADGINSKVRRRDFLAATSAELVPARAQDSRLRDAISIDGGRQLFFDDHLVAESTLERTWHLPTLHPASPLLRPETPLEMSGPQQGSARPFTDGLFYDPKDGLYKMWYSADRGGFAYATSEDGIRWTRPSLDIEPGTNRVLPARDGYRRDNCTVWLDHNAADPAQRFKLFAYFRVSKPAHRVGEVYTSPDGIHWKGPWFTGPCSDNTCFYYDTVRKLWVWSIRNASFVAEEQALAKRLAADPNGPRYPFGPTRKRCRREYADFWGEVDPDGFLIHRQGQVLLIGSSWQKSDIHGFRRYERSGESDIWLEADDMDLPDPQLGYQTQLYHFTAVGYESVMLGMFLIHRGPPNDICAQMGIPKTTDLTVGFSRDGVHWVRPDRRAFIACSRRPGTWNRGYIQATGGVCLVVGDELRFYFSASSGMAPQLGGSMGSTGMAVLRRDGFVSLDGGASGGAMTTPPVKFSGKYLFVNANAGGGELAAEALDESGAALPGFGVKECVPIHADGTRQPVRWKDARDLASLLGKPVRFRFHLNRARLYSFWVSSDPSGPSLGYVAAGGPGFKGARDTVAQPLNR